VLVIDLPLPGFHLLDFPVSYLVAQKICAQNWVAHFPILPFVMAIGIGIRRNLRP